MARPIEIVRLPVHIGGLAGKTFTKAASFESGLYLNSGENYLYFSAKKLLNPLSLEISKAELFYLLSKETDQETFSLDTSQAIWVDLGLDPAAGLDEEALIGAIEEANPITGLAGKDLKLLEAYPYMADLIESKGLAGLLGRGLGLTPSGDDCLIGMVFLAYMREESDFIADLQGQLDLERTNRISKNFILYAFQGYFSENMQALYKDKDLDRAVQGVIHYGHTSGADSLLGLYYGLKVKL